jgi:short-subunit dehydrogenase
MQALITTAAAHPAAAVSIALSTALLLRLARFVWKDDADASLLRARPPRPGAYARRTVWVTGASQGLGRELAARYARLGATVILSARRSPRLDAAVEAVGEAAAAAGAPPPVALPFDATAPADELTKVAAAAAAAASTNGGLGVDLLVLCAGASQHAAAAVTAPAVSDALFDLNAAAPVRLVSAALPGLLAAAAARKMEGGRNALLPSSSSSILAISSMAALVPAPGQAAYGASKAGLGHYLAALSAELADTGVAATVFMPGPVATGTEAAPRAVFGSGGPKHLPPPSAAEAAKRLSPGRAADLAVTAAAAGLPVAWAARQPILFLAYLAQWAPWAATAILRAVGPARAAGLEAGRGGYDVGGLARAAAGGRGK